MNYVGKGQVDWKRSDRFYLGFMEGYSRTEKKKLKKENKKECHSHLIFFKANDFLPVSPLWFKVLLTCGEKYMSQYDTE